MAREMRRRGTRDERRVGTGIKNQKKKSWFHRLASTFERLRPRLLSFFPSLLPTKLFSILLPSFFFFFKFIYIVIIILRINSYKYYSINLCFFFLYNCKSYFTLRCTSGALPGHFRNIPSSLLFEKLKKPKISIKSTHLNDNSWLHEENLPWDQIRPT